MGTVDGMWDCERDGHMMSDPVNRPGYCTWHGYQNRKD